MENKDKIEELRKKLTAGKQTPPKMDPTKMFIIPINSEIAQLKAYRTYIDIRLKELGEE